jgi:hypothetical protein
MSRNSVAWTFFNQLGISSHLEQVKKSLGQRTGLLRRLSHHVPRRELRQVAEGICLSKIRYGLAAYGVPQQSEDKPHKEMMQSLQVKQNEIARVLTGSRRRDIVPVLDLLERTGMMSVNQMAAETILMETGALTPINQNAIKQGKCGNMERGQTERGKSE